MRSRLGIFFGCLTLLSCAAPKLRPTAIRDPNPLPFRTDASDEQPTLEAVGDQPLEDLAAETGTSPAEKPAASKIEIVDHPSVSRWVAYFTDRDKERFQRYLDRGARYRPVVQAVLKEHNLPEDLYYLAMIESGFAVHARSHASAVGVWQFMKGTGQRYGLETNSHVDERRDPIRATEAAVKYLRDLYNAFQSWELAAAAYNCGENRVLRAIMKGNTRDYWTLMDKNLIPKETRDYVPKLMAAIIVGSDPERFGLRDPGKGESESYPSVEAVEVPSPVSLKSVAEVAGVSYDDLKAVNPHLAWGMTSPAQATYDLWIPKDAVEKVKATTATLAEHRIRGARVVASAENRNYHRVRRGETLGSIARKYRVSIPALRRINNLAGNKVMAGSRLRIATDHYVRMRAAPIRDQQPVVTYHRVKRGDNLYRIAKRYKTSVNAIRTANSKDEYEVYPGEKLSIPSASGGITVYRVRPGDSLSEISKKFNLTISSIKRLNNLETGRIYAGQRLKLAMN